MNKKLRRGSFMTDIHFGKKANSQVHNEDCLKYIDWFCEQVKSNGSDYVAFLGDWNENRSALNVATLHYSYLGAKKLNALGLPVFFCIGNHDLFHRHTREIYSVVPFQEFSNFVVIDNPLIVKQIGDGVLFSPYMFHDEYPGLMEYLKLPFWAGHFEFQGFMVTGYNVKMMTGPNPNEFKGPKHIVSGHFHKRQAQDNIVYMGNTFPMDFGDAGDNDRGMMVYDHVTDTMSFENWEQCPKYIKTKLSDIVDKKIKIVPEARVKCIIDAPVSYEESTYLRASMIEQHNLREFIMEETVDVAEALSGTDTEVNVENIDISANTIDDVVISMLREIKSEQIDNEILIDQYRKIQL